MHDDNPEDQPPTLTITGLEDLMGRTGSIDHDSYLDWCYVYGLVDASGQVWYIGTTTNPATRLLAHLQGGTKDSAPTIKAMRERGEVPTMQVLDITIREHRLELEAYWISCHPACRNTNRLPTPLKKYRANPTRYRSAALGTFMRCSTDHSSQQPCQS